MRILITLIICGVVLLPYILLTPESISNIYVLMILKTLVPTFAAGFLLYCGLLEYIFVHMKILEVEEPFNDPLLAPVTQDRQFNGNEYDSINGINNRLSLLENHASNIQIQGSMDEDAYR